MPTNRRACRGTPATATRSETALVATARRSSGIPFTFIDATPVGRLSRDSPRRPLDGRSLAVFRLRVRLRERLKRRHGTDPDIDEGGAV